MTVGITELPPEGMQLGGVALAGDADRGTKTTEGLSLLFTTAGITVQGPQPQIERLLVWSGLDTATCREKIALNDGRSAAVMELTSGGQSIRFLLPTETVTPGQAAYLDQALPAWLARYKGAPGTGPPPATGARPPASPGVGPAAAAAAGAAAGAAVAATADGAGDPAPAAEHRRPGHPAAAFTPPPPPTESAGPLSSPTPPASAPRLHPEWRRPAGSACAAAAAAASTLVGPSGPGSEHPDRRSSPGLRSTAPPPPPGPDVGQPRRHRTAGSPDGRDSRRPPRPATGAGLGRPAARTGPGRRRGSTAEEDRSWRKGRAGRRRRCCCCRCPGVRSVRPAGPPPTQPVPLTPGVLPPPPGRVPGTAAGPSRTRWCGSRRWIRSPGEAQWDSAYGIGAGVHRPDRGGAQEVQARHHLAPWGQGRGDRCRRSAPELRPCPKAREPHSVAPGFASSPSDAPAGTGAWGTTPGAGPADPFGGASFGPEDGSFPPDGGAGGKSGQSAEQPEQPDDRDLLLVALLALVVAGGAIYFVKEHNTNTTRRPWRRSSRRPVLRPNAGPQSINLRLSRPSAGWSRAPVAGQAQPPLHAAGGPGNGGPPPPLGPRPFPPSGERPSPGRSAPRRRSSGRRAASPTFASGSDPGIRDDSVTADHGHGRARPRRRPRRSPPPTSPPATANTRRPSASGAVPGPPPGPEGHPHRTRRGQGRSAT